MLFISSTATAEYCVLVDELKTVLAVVFDGVSGGMLRNVIEDRLPEVVEVDVQIKVQVPAEVQVQVSGPEVVHAKSGVS